MAVTFPDKQKWVASLEAAIKSLQRVDATFKRTVRYHHFLSRSHRGFDLEINKVNIFMEFFTHQKLQEFRVLELKGDRRLELNCTLIVSNHVSQVFVIKHSPCYLSLYMKLKEIFLFRHPLDLLCPNS